MLYCYVTLINLFPWGEKKLSVSVNYGVLAIIIPCAANTERRFRIVSPREMPLLLFTDKECGV